MDDQKTFSQCQRCVIEVWFTVQALKDMVKVQIKGPKHSLAYDLQEEQATRNRTQGAMVKRSRPVKGKDRSSCACVNTESTPE